MALGGLLGTTFWRLEPTCEGILSFAGNQDPTYLDYHVYIKPLYLQQEVCTYYPEYGEPLNPWCCIPFHHTIKKIILACTFLGNPKALVFVEHSKNLGFPRNIKTYFAHIRASSCISYNKTKKTHYHLALQNLWPSNWLPGIVIVLIIIKYCWWIN